MIYFNDFTNQLNKNENVKIPCEILKVVVFVLFLQLKKYNTITILVYIPKLYFKMYKTNSHFHNFIEHILNFSNVRKSPIKIVM